MQLNRLLKNSALYQGTTSVVPYQIETPLGLQPLRYAFLRFATVSSLSDR